MVASIYALHVLSKWIFGEASNASASYKLGYFVGFQLRINLSYDTIELITRIMYCRRNFYLTFFSSLFITTFICIVLQQHLLQSKSS